MLMLTDLTRTQAELARAQAELARTWGNQGRPRDDRGRQRGRGGHQAAHVPHDDTEGMSVTASSHKRARSPELVPGEHPGSHLGDASAADGADRSKLLREKGLRIATGKGQGHLNSCGGNPSGLVAVGPTGRAADFRNHRPTTVDSQLQKLDEPSVSGSDCGSTRKDGGQSDDITELQQQLAGTGTGPDPDVATEDLGPIAASELIAKGSVGNTEKVQPVESGGQGRKGDKRVEGKGEGGIGEVSETGWIGEELDKGGSNGVKRSPKSKRKKKVYHSRLEGECNGLVTRLISVFVSI
ncbi:hypothetical protein FRC11_002648 [Ceratobasidium sp. 423]|nr:hypothetical protein FRC11_002648 [Ceratobasidium sp. 423]